MMNKNAILLDFDGTILNNLSQMYFAYEDFMQHIKQEPSQKEFDKGNGIPLRKSLSKMKKKYNLNESLSALEEKYHRCIKKRTESVKPRAGLISFLENQTACDKKISIVSSNKKTSINNWLKKNNLEKYITLVIGSEDVKNGKPDPEPYYLAMNHLGIAASLCIAVEDSSMGVLSASKAGIDTFQIIEKKEQFNKPSEHAFRVVNDFYEIQKIIDAV